jgi:ADP-heptose:LPS heptosyltransferase
MHQGIITEVQSPIPLQRSSIQPENISFTPTITGSDSLERLDRIRRGDKVKICIARTQGGIGDVLMTTPTVRAIKERYNPCELTYSTDFSYLNSALTKVLQDNPYIDKVVNHLTDRPNSYDAYINLTCPCIPHEQPKAIPIHRIDLFANFAGVELKDRSMIYNVKEEERKWARRWLEERAIDSKNHKIILVNPYASNARRSWEPRRWLETMAYITHEDKSVRVIVVTHGSDFDKTKFDLVNTIKLHDYDIRSIAALVEASNLVLCPDSAILHIAQVFNKPTIAVFGPTDWRARTNYSPLTTAISHGAEVMANPCWYDARCPCNLSCMRMCLPEEVLYIAKLKLADPLHTLPVYPVLEKTSQVIIDSSVRKNIIHTETL